MKAKKIFTAILKFIVKHWVWLWPVACTVVYLFCPEKKHAGSFIAGMAVIGALWGFVHAVRHYFKAGPQNESQG